MPDGPVNAPRCFTLRLPFSSATYVLFAPNSPLASPLIPHACLEIHTNPSETKLLLTEQQQYFFR